MFCPLVEETAPAKGLLSKAGRIPMRREVFFLSLGGVCVCLYCVCVAMQESAHSLLLLLHSAHACTHPLDGIFGLWYTCVTRCPCGVKAAMLQGRNSCGFLNPLCFATSSTPFFIFSIFFLLFQVEGQWWREEKAPAKRSATCARIKRTHTAQKRGKRKQPFSFVLLGAYHGSLYPAGRPTHHRRRVTQRI